MSAVRYVGKRISKRMSNPWVALWADIFNPSRLGVAGAKTHFPAAENGRFTGRGDKMGIFKGDFPGPARVGTQHRLDSNNRKKKLLEGITPINLKRFMLH